MKKLGFTFGLLAVLVLTAPAFAGNVVSGSTPGSAHTITISGDVKVTGYFRDEALNMVVDQVGYTEALDALIGDPEQFDASDTAYMYAWYVQLDAELADKVSGCVQIGNRPVLGTGGPGSMTDTFGDGGNFVTLNLAYITVEEFLSQHLTWSIGIQDLKYDLRGNGNAFYLDLRNSELAFLSPTTEAFGGEVYGYDYAGELAIGGSGFAGLTRTRNETAGGWKLTYNDSDTVFVDIFAFTVAEALNGGGAASFGSADETLYGINLDYNFGGSKDRRDLFSAIFTVNTMDQSQNKVYTIGAGIDYFWERLELYAELYYQFGDYSYITPVDSPFFGLAGANETVDQSSWAGYLGGRYNFDSEYKPYLDLSFWYLSGDDGDVDDNGGMENSDFVSYENVNSSMIMEDSTFGLDVDSNYWAIKLDAGFTTTTGLKPNDLMFSLFYGFFQTVEDPDRVGLANAATALDVEGDLGSEIDLKVKWMYNESLSFTLGAGWLFGGNFWGDRTSAAQALAGIGGGYQTGQDNMQLYTFTTDLKF